MTDHVFKVDRTCFLPQAFRIEAIDTMNDKRHVALLIFRTGGFDQHGCDKKRPRI